MESRYVAHLPSHIPPPDKPAIDSHTQTGEKSGAGWNNTTKTRVGVRKPTTRGEERKFRSQNLIFANPAGDFSCVDQSRFFFLVLRSVLSLGGQVGGWQRGGVEPGGVLCLRPAPPASLSSPCEPRWWWEIVQTRRGSQTREAEEAEAIY